MGQAVINKTNLLQQIKQHRNTIKSYGVKSLGLFGSFATDTVKIDSDIDFLVEFEHGKKSYDNFMDLSFYLEELLGRRIELITPQSLSQYIGPHILKQIEYVYL